EMANGAGGPDNISVIVAYVAGEGARAPTDADKVEYKLWKIDPEIPLVAPPDGEPAAPVPMETRTRAQMHLRRPQGNPTAELISMAVIVGLVLGSLLTGAVI